MSRSRKSALTAALAVTLAVTGTTAAAEGTDTPDLTRLVGAVGEVLAGGGLGGGDRLVWGGRTFLPPAGTASRDAVVYDEGLVPSGASAKVTQLNTRQGMEIALSVRGFLEDRSYGARVHTRPCGTQPGDSGPRYQDVQDPRTPSTDPRYANPDNEVWLDFTTDGYGRGDAVSAHSWRFRPGGARSVVVHEHPAGDDSARTGDTGRRVACVTVPFSPAERG